MPCDEIRARSMREKEEREKLEKELAELEEAIISGQVSIMTNGVESYLEGWQAKYVPLMDVCALAMLANSQTFEIQEAIRLSGTTKEQLILNHNHH